MFVSAHSALFFHLSVFGSSRSPEINSCLSADNLFCVQQAGQKAVIEQRVTDRCSMVILQTPGVFIDVLSGG